MEVIKIFAVECSVWRIIQTYAEGMVKKKNEKNIKSEFYDKYVYLLTKIVLGLGGEESFKISNAFNTFLTNVRNVKKINLKLRYLIILFFCF